MCGAAAAASANLDENSPKRRCWLRRSISAEGGGVPERRGAAVAEDHLVAVGEGQQLGEPVAQRTDLELHAGLPVRGAEVRAPLGRIGRCQQRLNRLGPDLGRAAAEAAVGGQQVGGDLDLGGGGGSHRAMIANGPSKERDRCRPPEPSAASRARIAAIAESATLAVDAKAKALKAAGEPVIGFGAGEPDFPTPAAIVEAAVAACRDPKNHKYTPAGGLPELKDAIVAKTARDSGYPVTSGQVLVTNGGKHAVYNTFAALLDPGDEVLLPAPYWTTYPEPIALAGGVPVVLPTDETTGFRVTVEQLDAAVTERTKVLLFVSPSNPTGRRVPRGRGRGHRALGGREGRSGSSPTRSTSTSPTATTATRRCPRSCPSWRTAVSC